MIKKIGLMFLLTLVILTVSNTAVAAYNPSIVNSDPIFSAATITLTTYKTADFTADTNYIMNSIKVTSCWLQKKVNNTWVYVCSLPAPTNEMNNTIGYDGYMDYSSYIPSDGNTYRIGAYFNADGHSIPRYSNARTF